MLELLLEQTEDKSINALKTLYANPQPKQNKKSIRAIVTQEVEFSFSSTIGQTRIVDINVNRNRSNNIYDDPYQFEDINDIYNSIDDALENYGTGLGVDTEKGGNIEIKAIGATRKFQFYKKHIQKKKSNENA